MRRRADVWYWYWGIGGGLAVPRDAYGASSGHSSREYSELHAVARISAIQVLYGKRVLMLWSTQVCTVLRRATLCLEVGLNVHAIIRCATSLRY